MIILICILMHFRRKNIYKKNFFYKARINAEINRAELYTRMLDETKEEMKARESELRHIQEGWEIREEDIKLIKKIGSGSYANVYRGEWEPLDGTPVAIKVLNITPATSQKSFFNDTETQVLQRIRHPRLVLFFGFGMMSKGNNFIVTEYIDGGDLKVYLGQGKESNGSQKSIARYCIIPCQEASSICFRYC